MSEAPRVSNRTTKGKPPVRFIDFETMPVQRTPIGKTTEEVINANNGENPLTTSAPAGFPATDQTGFEIFSDEEGSSKDVSNNVSVAVENLERKLAAMEGQCKRMEDLMLSQEQTMQNRFDMLLQQMEAFNSARSANVSSNNVDASMTRPGSANASIISEATLNKMSNLHHDIQSVTVLPNNVDASVERLGRANASIISADNLINFSDSSHNAQDVNVPSNNDDASAIRPSSDNASIISANNLINLGNSSHIAQAVNVPFNNVGASSSGVGSANAPIINVDNLSNVRNSSNNKNTNSISSNNVDASAIRSSNPSASIISVTNPNNANNLPYDVQTFHVSPNSSDVFAMSSGIGYTSTNIATNSKSVKDLPNRAQEFNILPHYEVNATGHMPRTTLQPITSTISSNTFSSQPVYLASPNRNKKIYPLPHFSGDPTEWQAFFESFKSTTEEFEYSDIHNIMRLREALIGKAKESVEALLTSSKNVSDIMNILEETFGRPEQLIRNQIIKIRHIKTVPEKDPESLVDFANKINTIATFLKNANGQHHLTNPLLLSELIAKLPNEQQMQWAEKCLSLVCQPSIVDFSEWLNGIRKIASRVVDSLPLSEAENFRSIPKTRSVRKPQNERQYGQYVNNASVRSCQMCTRQCDNLESCEAFKKLNVNERWAKVRDMRLCFNCLKGGHQLSRCFKRIPCGKDNCLKMHNQLLHEDIEESYDCNVAEMRNCHADGNDIGNSVLFPILPVRLYSENIEIETFAFVDDGANVSIIDEELCSQLNIKGVSDYLEIQWLNSHASRTRTEIVSVEISGVHKGALKYRLSKVYTSKDLSLPVQSFKRQSILNTPLQNLPIREYSNVKPKIILSLAHVYWTVPIEKPIMTKGEGPIAVKTRLGWIVYGPITSQIGTKMRSCHIYSKDDIEKMNVMMENYFDNETFGVKSDVKELLSDDDQRALHLLSETVKYSGDRYEAGLLWREFNVNVPSSFEMAVRRLESVERKMQRDDEYARLYKDKINSYLEKGYARKIDEPNENCKGPIFYLPHFGVRNPNKHGIRIVFDAAAEVQNISLNKCLLAGPDLNQPLLAILFKFRQAPIAVCGDIKEMFHQVKIRADDLNSQRFLWRDGCPTNPLKTYVMERMIFGAACSPVTAQYVKNINAQKFIDDYPRAVKGIIERHYVDDYVDSFQSEREAIATIENIIDIHRKAGFEMRNILSNSVEVMSIFGNEGAEKTKSLNYGLERILGVKWNLITDSFMFTVNLQRISKDILNLTRVPTKREILSIIMSVFDPIGFLVQFMITAKLLMQDIWKCGIEWDDQIPADLFKRFSAWITELPNIDQVEIPRCYYLKFENLPVSLHIFSDASEEAVAVAAYWRIVCNGEVSLSFVAGKSSCAPTRYHSIPKLELQAAVLAVRLKNTIVKYHEKVINKITLWTDSRTVLQWIRSDHRKYKQYVANRVAEILEASSMSDWKWCPGEQNPADCATRAQPTPKFLTNTNWLLGPKFLHENEDKWPLEQKSQNINPCQIEMKSKFCVGISFQCDEIDRAINRCSNYLKLIRTFGWMNRFCSNAKRSAITAEGRSLKGELSCDEISSSETMLCRYIQRKHFKSEYRCLSQKEIINKDSQIRSLNPGLDEDGLIRCIGRITNAQCLPESARQPIILPNNDRFTSLLVSYYHTKFYHECLSTVMCEIRQKFWIPSLRRLLRSVQSTCMECKIKNAKPLQPQMAPLPVDRVTPFVRPFSYTGLDYFGPFYVTIRRAKEKRWVALFTCLTVRAVHLEVASSLSSDSCLLCIRNFLNRRGVPKQIRSDNGSNFIGINKELNGSTDFLDHDQMTAKLAPLGIKWIFNTPANPSQGGAWERLVQSVKKVLHRMFKDHAPRLDTFTSFLTEAENIVNSRPLTHLSVTPEEPEPITPNHFLLGCLNSTQTPDEFDPMLDCSRKQWKQLKNLKNKWWKQWIREYLPELTRRSKWFLPSEPISVGCLVFVCDSDLPRSQWRRGRVIELLTGKDGTARSAKVSTTGGVMIRPISKLAVLNVENVKDGESPPAESNHGGGVVVDAAIDNLK